MVRQQSGATRSAGLILALGVGLTGCGGGTDTAPSKPPVSHGDTGTTTPPPSLFTGTPASLPSNGRPDSYAYYGLGVDSSKPPFYDQDQQKRAPTPGSCGPPGTRTSSGSAANSAATSHLHRDLRLLNLRTALHRFQRLGMINEPNCEEAKEPDEYGFWLDKWKGDPYKDAYPDTKTYGEPTGVVGLRKFPNPKFDKSKWDRKHRPRGILP